MIKIKTAAVLAALMASRIVLAQDCEEPPIVSTEAVEICNTVNLIHPPFTTKSPYVIEFNSDKVVSYSHFKIILWQSDAHCLEINPYVDLLGKNVCVSAEEKTFKGIKQLVIKSVTQVPKSP